MSIAQQETIKVVAYAAASILCLVALAYVEHKPCRVAVVETLATMPLADMCGTERERIAINDE